MTLDACPDHAGLVVSDAGYQFYPDLACLLHRQVDGLRIVATAACRLLGEFLPKIGK